MPRTPMPEDSVFHTARLDSETVAQLEEMQAATGIPSAIKAVNLELDFLRTWLLPEHFTRRLEAEAQRRGFTPVELVTDILFDVAAALPPAPLPKPPKSGDIPARPPRKKYRIAVTGPNEAWLLRQMEHWRVDAYEVGLERALEFARSYGLPPASLAALRQRAKADGATLRELVIDTLMGAVDGFARAAAPPPPPAAPPPKRAHPRRSDS